MAIAYALVVAVPMLRKLPEFLSGMTPADGLLLAGGAVALASITLRRIPFRIAGAAAAVAMSTMIVRSALAPAAVAAGVLGASFLVGEAIHRVLGGAPDLSRTSRVSISFGLGAATVGVTVLVLGFLRLLYTGVLGAFLLGAAAIALLLRPRSAALPPDSPSARPRHPEESPAPERFFLAVVIGFTALWTLPRALAPESSFDALNYHLPVPRDWLAAHAIVGLPYWHSSLAHLAEAYFVVPFSFGGAPAVKLVVYGLVLMLTVAAYSIARELFGRRAAPWAAAFLLSSPVVASLATNVEADCLTSFFVASAVLAFLRLDGSGNSRTAAVFGVLAGAAVGTKINAAYAVAVPTAVLVARAASGRLSRRAAAAGLTTMSAIALPWFVMTYRFTGNPVFPFLNGWFRSPLAAPKNRIMNAAAFGIGTAPLSWLRLPLALTFQTYRFGEGLLDGAAGLSFLLLPVLLAGATDRTLDRRHGVATGIVAVYAIAWGATFQYARYFTAVLPIVAALSLGATVNLPAGAARRIAMTAAGLALAAQTALTIRSLPSEGTDRWAFAFGERTFSEELHRVIPPIDCFRAVARWARPGDRVATGEYRRRFYIPAPIDSESEWLPFRKRVHGLSGAALRDALWSNGDRFVLASTSPHRVHYAFEEPEFLDRFAEALCEEQDIRLLALRPPGRGGP